MKIQLSKIKAVIFDWAGTTIDYGSRAPTQVFIEMFRRRAVAITEAEAREPMGMAKHAHIAAIAAMPRVRNAWAEVHGSHPTSADVDSIYSEFLPLQQSVLASHCDVIPGVLQTVARLRSENIKIGSSTGYTRQLMDIVIPLARAAGYEPDVCVCADEVTAGRPAPWLNFRVAELLGVYPLEHVIVVDDTLVGIQAGLAAGAITVAASKTGNALGLSEAEVRQLAPDDLAARLQRITAEFSAAGAHAVVESVADLYQLFADA